MKQLSNELHWPDLKKDTIDQLYLYSICTDDLLEVPAKEGGFLCYSVKSCFPDPGMCDLEDVFFRESGHSMQFLFGQLHCIHNGEYDVPLSALRIKYDGSAEGTEWLSEEDTVTFQKTVAMALASRIIKLNEDGSCSILPRMVVPRVYEGPKMG